MEPQADLPRAADCRELLLAATFTGYVVAIGDEYLSKQLNGWEYMIFFLGVFVFWADATQLRNRCRPGWASAN